MVRAIRILLSCILLSGIYSAVEAQSFAVRIQPQSEITRFTYQAIGSEVLVTAHDSFPQPVCTLSALQQIEVKNELGWVQLKRNGKILGKFRKVTFWCNDEDSRFNLLLDKNVTKTYYDHLEVGGKGRALYLNNRVYIENYIRGVIFAEAGIHRSLEFYKVQATSARTYAYKHIGRHKKEGYDLCDNTHCQAYKGTFKSNPLIHEAVEKTKRQVIVFKSKELIEAVFSANCGGFTANSEDVWISEVNYLRAVPDYNFCEGFNNHAWHLMVTKLEFLEKLGDYHKVNAQSFEIVPDVSGRVRRIMLNGDPKLSISGEELRRIFRTKSSKFHILENGNLLFIEGAGFGHGVGMCQDGAYYLSEMGLDYVKILKHYYQGIELLTLPEYVQMHEVAN